MIRKLRMAGWRSHWSSEFDFCEGTNGLLGVMGAGKSSVLEAISFALFGTFPARQSGRLALDDVIMKRPQKRDRAEVELTFDADGSTYVVKRTIERGRKADAEIRRDGKLLDVGVTKVTDFVERILRIDYELFARAVYAEQNGLDYFLEIPRGQRMKKMDALLSIDRFESARTSANTIVNRLKTGVSDRRAMLKELESAEEFARIDALREELVALTSSLVSLKKEYSSLSQSVQSAEKRLSEHSEKMREVELTERARSASSSAVSVLETELTDMPPDDVGERATDVVEQIEEAQDLIEALRTKRNDALGIKQRIVVSIEEAERRAKRVEGVGSKCPVCEQALDEEHKTKIISERDAIVSNLTKDLDRVNGEIAKIDERTAEQKKELMEFEQTRRKLDVLVAKLRDSSERRARLDVHKENVKTLDTKLARLKEGFDVNAGAALQKELSSLVPQTATVSTEIRSIERTVTDKSAVLERLNERKKLFEEYRNQIAKMEKLLDELVKFVSALEEIQISLRREFVASVNGAMSQIWESVYPYGDYINVRLATNDGDYVLQLKENGGDWTNVEGVASGGERTTALLALRIAFALVLAPHLRWLVLDEPTHNLDTQAVEQLAETLRERMSAHVEQIFLITHEEKLENAVTAYAYRLERDAEKNGPTRVACVLSPLVHAPA